MLKNDWVRTALTLLAATLITDGLRAVGISRESLLMVYMVGVMCCAAITHGYRYSILSAVGSMMLFNYFYTEPLRTFLIGSENDATLLVFFLITAILSAGMIRQPANRPQVASGNRKGRTQRASEKRNWMGP